MALVKAQDVQSTLENAVTQINTILAGFEKRIAVLEDAKPKVVKGKQ